MVGAATRTLETARALEQLPETDAAFRTGALSETQAADITSTAIADPSAEVALLEAAGSTSVKGLRDRCRQVRAGAEADDRAWARRLHERRRAHKWTDPDGTYRLEGRLAPDAGARFDAAWEAHIDRIFREARRAGRHEPRAAYAADALVALASEGPCKPVEVRVTVDSSALARGCAEAGERCELDRVGPVPFTTARALLDDASVAVLLRDGDDVTAVSSPKRTIPIKLRRALEALHPTCGVKGCANDRFLEIDHIVPLSEGGRTELANLWRPCSHHHVLKTYFGWKVVGEPATGTSSHQTTPTRHDRSRRLAGDQDLGVARPVPEEAVGGVLGEESAHVRFEGVETIVVQMRGRVRRREVPGEDAVDIAHDVESARRKDGSRRAEPRVRERVRVPLEVGREPPTGAAARAEVPADERA
jgi:hypothetical protein